MLRDKKTQCPSHLQLSVQIPTKKQVKLEPHLLTHTGVLKLVFIHNHPITSAHALSFRDISEETKQALYSLFELGHSPSSARHAHEQALYIQAESEAEAQLCLADCAHNPLIQDICRLFIKWREATLLYMVKIMVKTYSKNSKKKWTCTTATLAQQEEKLFYIGIKLQLQKTLRMNLNLIMNHTHHPQNVRGEESVINHSF